MTLIEQAARTLCKKRRLDPDCGKSGTAWRQWHQFVPEIVAVFDAIASAPTLVMCEHGLVEWETATGNGELNTEASDMALVFEAMIKAALLEGAINPQP